MQKDGNKLAAFRKSPAHHASYILPDILAVENHGRAKIVGTNEAIWRRIRLIPFLPGRFVGISNCCQCHRASNCFAPVEGHWPRRHPSGIAPCVPLRRVHSSGELGKEGEVSPVQVRITVAAHVNYSSTLRSRSFHGVHRKNKKIESCAGAPKVSPRSLALHAGQLSQFGVPSFVPTTEPYRVLRAFEGSRLSPRGCSTCSIRWYFVADGVSC